MAMARAHPRSRGEHDEEWADSVRLSGSSPLARGTPGNGLTVALTDGLIPARAGNTIIRRPPPLTVRAHPRSRGEHMEALGLFLIIWGSSPLARGTHTTRSLHSLGLGLIPARAGNTLKMVLRLNLMRAHPRSRGEHPGEDGATEIHPGSSPLARGTPFTPLLLYIENGLIPARAGNTRVRPMGFAEQRAHPRSRGEHLHRKSQIASS